MRLTLYHQLLSSFSPESSTFTGIRRESRVSKVSVTVSGSMDVTRPELVVAFSGTAWVPAVRTLERSSITCTLSAETWL